MFSVVILAGNAYRTLAHLRRGAEYMTPETTGMLLSPQSPCRYLETDINQHLVMNYG